MTDDWEIMNGYPINYEVEYGNGERSRGLAVAGILWVLKALLLLPHLIVMIFLLLVSMFAAWIGYFAIAFTGKQPEGIANLIRGTISWVNRTQAWLYSTTDEYPPFTFEAPSYPAQTSVEGDIYGERSKGWAVLGIFFLKGLAALPHLIILAILGWAAGIAAWIGYWVIAFTGELPRGLHDFFGGYQQWTARTYGWLGSLTDEYPPFTMQ